MENTGLQPFKTEQPLLTQGYTSANNNLTSEQLLFDFINDMPNSITNNRPDLSGVFPAALGQMPVDSANQTMSALNQGGIPNYPAAGNTLTPNHGLYDIISNIHNLINKYSNGLYFKVLGQMGELDATGKPELGLKNIQDNQAVNNIIGGDMGAGLNISPVNPATNATNATNVASPLAGTDLGIGDMDASIFKLLENLI